MFRGILDSAVATVGYDDVSTISAGSVFTVNEVLICLDNIPWEPVLYLNME